MSGWVVIVLLGLGDGGDVKESLRRKLQMWRGDGGRPRAAARGCAQAQARVTAIALEAQGR